MPETSTAASVATSSSPSTARPAVGAGGAALAWVGRVVVSGVFIVAALGKLSDLPRFAKEIRDYQIAPIELSNAMAIIVPWLELVVVASLLSGLWRREGRVLLALMLVAFTAAKVSAETRGLEIACGCFGGFAAALDKSLSGINGIILNVVLLGLLWMEFACSRTPRVASSK